MSTEKITRISPRFNLSIATSLSSEKSPFALLYTATDGIPRLQNSFDISSACSLVQQNPNARLELYLQ